MNYCAKTFISCIRLWRIISLNSSLSISISKVTNHKLQVFLASMKPGSALKMTLIKKASKSGQLKMTRALKTTWSRTLALWSEKLARCRISNERWLRISKKIGAKTNSRHAIFTLNIWKIPTSSQRTLVHWLILTTNLLMTRKRSKAFSRRPNLSISIWCKL